jgi:hypothetical protein
MNTGNDSVWLLDRLNESADRMSVVYLEADAPFSINVWGVGSDLFVGPLNPEAMEEVVRVRPKAQPAVIEDVFQRAVSANRVVVRARNNGDEMEFVAVRSDGVWTITDGDEPPREGGRADLWCAIARAWRLSGGAGDG